MLTHSTRIDNTHTHIYTQDCYALMERLVSCRHRRTDCTSYRAVEHTENANGKRPRSGQGAGHFEQHDHTRREQLHGFKRQVPT